MIIIIVVNYQIKRLTGCPMLHVHSQRLEKVKVTYIIIYRLRGVLIVHSATISQPSPIVFISLLACVWTDDVIVLSAMICCNCVKNTLNYTQVACNTTMIEKTQLHTHTTNSRQLIWKKNKRQKNWEKQTITMQLLLLSPVGFSPWNFWKLISSSPNDILSTLFADSWWRRSRLWNFLR